MKKYIIFLLIIFITGSVYAGRSIEERKAELLGLTPVAGKTAPEKGFVTIQSIKKGKITRWVWKKSSFGGNEMASVDVRFKINERGRHHLSCFKVYLFDKHSNSLLEIDRGFLQDATSEQKIQDVSSFEFKGKKTYVLRFPVPSDMIKYKNAVAVIGKGSDLSAKSLRKSIPLSALDFPEVSLVK
jgi:hypothetical protein